MPVVLAEQYLRPFSLTIRPRTVWLGLFASVVAVASFVEPGQAALVVGGDVASVLSGRDEDNVDNAAIQPAGVTAAQSSAWPIPPPATSSWCASSAVPPGRCW